MSETDSRTDAMDSEELAALLRQATRLMARVRHRHDQAHHAQSRVLALLEEKGPINQSELLEILDVRSSSLSELLGKLERNGLIARQRDARDRRSYVIAATQPVAALDQDPEGGRSHDSERLFACLDAGERTQLGHLLAKLVAALKEAPACREARCGHHGRGRHHPGHGFGHDRDRDFDAPDQAAHPHDPHGRGRRR